MKNLTLMIAFALCSLTAGAQTAVTSLHENFDVDCVLASDFPSAWLEYNPITATIPDGQWTCAPASGRPNTSLIPTPGITCTGTYGTSPAYHLDTSFLITPLLDLRSYSHAYLQFDTRTENIHLGGKLSVLMVADSLAYNPASPTINFDSSMSPVFGDEDSSGWVTHEVDISMYTGSKFYIAFRYTSTDTSGTAWYLDNVNISPTRLQVDGISKNILPLTVIGNSTPDDITVSFAPEEAGLYYMVMYDMMGRIVYHRHINVATGVQAYSIKGLGLPPGMYFIKMTGDNTYGTAKVMVQ